jgi:choline dehydrogenase
MEETFDVIVVGAGTSGGTIASRLTESRDIRVLLLEAGPDFPDEETRLPLFAVSGEHSWRVAGVPEFDWNFVNEDKAGAFGGRRIILPRGRLVGGSSMVNSTIAARPAPFDMDRWAELGCPGWGWDATLPYFRRIETDRDYGDQDIHGDSGPIVVQRYARERWAPVNALFAEACSDLGVRERDDLNGLDSHAGVFGRMPHNRFKEVRQGTLVTYLRAARKRPNLVLMARCHVDRLLIEKNRAVGVTWIDARGARQAASAETIVVSAGVYNTPAVLQRSGIGPATHLASLGVPVVADLPVGLALTDHPGCALFFHAPSVAGTTGRFFATNWRGPAHDGPEPWWQIHPFPVDEEEGLCGLWAYLTRQHSGGSVEAVSTDPLAPPRIDHGYLVHPEDLRRFADAWEAMLALLATPAMCRAGARAVGRDKPLREHLRDGLASAHHQSGTCRMGASPRDSVVSPQLQVHGVDGLMVADSSVFPDTVMHNTNLTCHVVGEIAADLITGRRGPAAIPPLRGERT